MLIACNIKIKTQPRYPDEFYDNVDALERQGISTLHNNIRKRCPSNKEIQQQISLYDQAIEAEDDIIDENCAELNSLIFENESFMSMEISSISNNKKPRKASVATNEKINPGDILSRTSVRQQKLKGLISNAEELPTENTLQKMRDHAKNLIFGPDAEKNSSRKSKKSIELQEKEYRRLKMAETNKAILNQTEQHLKKKKKLNKEMKEEAFNKRQEREARSPKVLLNRFHKLPKFLSDESDCSRDSCGGSQYSRSSSRGSINSRISSCVSSTNSSRRSSLVSSSRKSSVVSEISSALAKFSNFAQVKTSIDKVSIFFFQTKILSQIEIFNSRNNELTRTRKSKSTESVYFPLIRLLTFLITIN